MRCLIAFGFGAALKGACLLLAYTLHHQELDAQPGFELPAIRRRPPTPYVNEIAGAYAQQCSGRYSRLRHTETSTADNMVTGASS